MTHRGVLFEVTFLFFLNIEIFFIFRIFFIFHIFCIFFTKEFLAALHYLHDGLIDNFPCMCYFRNWPEFSLVKSYYQVIV